MIGPKSKIGPNARISATVIGRNCAVGSGSAVTGCVLLDGSVVGSDCVVSGCALGRGVVVKDGVSVGREAVVGNRTVVDRDIKERSLVNRTFDFAASVSIAKSEKSVENRDIKRHSEGGESGSKLNKFFGEVF